MAIPKHGLANKIPEYYVWKTMIQRCTNPKNAKYRIYGARGITVCDSWRDFRNFYGDMGKRPSPKHSIHRINNNGNYDPKNCKWATGKEQMRATRTNRFLTLKGVSRTVAEWAEILNVSQDFLHNRITRKWSDERILTTPPYANGKSRRTW